MFKKLAIFTTGIMLVINLFSACKHEPIPTPIIETPKPTVNIETPTPEITTDEPEITQEYLSETPTIEQTIQTEPIDLDDDGVFEEVTVYRFFCTVKIKNKFGEWSVNWNEYDHISSINFEKFDQNSSLTQFYLYGIGPGSGYGTAVFSFDGKQIIKNFEFPDEIRGFDGKGRIYPKQDDPDTFYYDLYNGFTQLPKKDIIGKKIKRSFPVLLFKNPGTEQTAYVLSGQYEDTDWKYEGNDKDEFVCHVPRNTSLTIVDVKFEKYEHKDEYDPSPWFKVKTSDGKTGWFSVYYGS